MTNPYLNRTAIRDDASFVGRAAELKRLFNRIGGPQPQSVSIVGDRRIGKSSLLRAVLARRGKFLSKPEGYLFVYLDMQSRLRWTPEMFFERLAAEMGSAGADTSAITDYDSLERCVPRAAAGGTRARSADGRVPGADAGRRRRPAAR